MVARIGLRLITGLSEIYKGYKEKKGKEKDLVAKELLVVPRELAPVFVEPDLQPYNPADDLGTDRLFREKCFTVFEDFINTRMDRDDGRRHLFLLAEAGMGKTSILAMFKLAHVNGLWLKNYNCVPLKLGPNSLEKIEEIQSRGETVLLLDALDEDNTAFSRVDDRIVELLKATQGFFRVIITCRNQFLPLGDNKIFPRPDRIKLGGFTCPVNYVSPFSDGLVRDYLTKKFYDAKTVEKAHETLTHMDDLQFRPMLLSYIDDLLEEGAAENIYVVYKTLVNKWLDREQRKAHGIPAEELLKACIVLARKMIHEGVREIEERSISEMLLDHPELEHLKKTDIGGRSLLNRNSDGAFRFAHQSFQEFLVVLALEPEHGFGAGWPEPFEMIVQFVSIGGVKNLKGANLNRTNLSEANLSGADLRRADLREASLSGADLRRADLREANLQGARLQGAVLQGAYLQKAILAGAVLQKAILAGAVLLGAYLQEANLQGANLRGANLQGAELHRAELQGANIYGIIKASNGFRERALENGAVEEPS